MITSSPERIEAYTQKGWWRGHTLHGALLQQSHDNPDMLAVADQPDREQLTGDRPLRLSFAEVERASTNLAAQLLQAGITNDDAVIVQIPNIAELYISYMALSKIGAIISPVPIQYGPHELRHIAHTINAKAIITIARFKDQPLAGNGDLISDLNLQALVFGHNLSVNSDLNSQSVNALQAHRQGYKDDANNIITICWTSGTTGTPKGVPRSHNMWVATATNVSEAADFRSGDRFLNIFPLVNMASVGALLYPSVLTGCSLFLHHPLDPAVFLGQLQDEQISFTIAPPALLNQLAKSEQMWRRYDFSKLRSVGSGSTALAPWMIETFGRNYGVEVLNFYGSNEGISLFCTPLHCQDPETRATMFPRLGCGSDPWGSYAGTTVLSKVVDVDSGEEITEVGKMGELLFNGATVFDGYTGTDNSDVFTTDGYFRTGDLVEICGEPGNFYRIAGRSKDIINRGGMKISPAEIDVLLEALPNSLEAAVCAYADEHLGEKICACVVADPDGEPVNLDKVIEHLNSFGVAVFKLPERIELFPALPRNPIGKVQRFVLQEQVAQRIKESH
jgi:non-ribosomal peptide synthetase component E (peptide arylation enzyme)